MTCLSAASRCLAGCVLSLAMGMAVPGAQAAPKSPGKVAIHVVVVTNHRTSAVVALGFGTDEDEKPPANLLKTPLKPGQTRKLDVSAKPDLCTFTVSGAYADGTEISGAGLNLCEDHALVLVD